jgi:hypothetical protein
LGAYDIETIEYYNRVWKVNRCDIENFKFHYENGNVQNGSYQIPKDVLEWPANPFPVGYNRPLAPYYDYNADGFYNPYDGDYPQIKGEQMLWWIGNDQIVNDWNLESLGLEVRFSLYAYTNVNSGSSLLPLNFSYFWEIEFTNVSDEKIDSLHLVSQIDGDIGFAQDDYVRYNVDLNSATFYNGFDLDGAGAPDQYGYHWPLMSVGMVEGVYSEYENQVVKNHNFIAYNNGVCPINCEPQSFGDFMNFINGKWRNGTEVGYGGNGVAAPSGTATNIPTKYMFPGFSDPNHTATNGVDPGWAWREEESVLGGEQNPVGDRRGFMSTGPFKLEAGASKKITYMYHHTFDSTGMTTEEKIQKNRLEQMQLIEWFENNSFPSDCLGDGVLSVNEAKTKAPEIAIYPNPANTWLNVQVDGMKGHIAIEILDINGRVVLQHASTHSLTTLDLTPLKSGIYILRVNDGESLITKKLIVN